MQADPNPYEPGTRLAYRHRGAVLLADFVKGQRRHALLRNSKGHVIKVPWTAVVGVPPRKPKPGPTAP